VTWKCRLLKAFPGKENLRVGDLWFSKIFLERFAHRLSREYERDHAGRRLPLSIMLPGREVVCLDEVTGSGRVDGSREGLTVRGEAPMIDVLSIRIPGVYNGFIKNGVIAPDADKRRYDARGNLLQVHLIG
jgi:hypothetical protein